MTEMFVSFLVLFAVFSLMVYNYNNYKKPMGFDYENVWVVNYDNNLNISNTDSLLLFYETFRQKIKSLPQVKEVSFTSSNVPFSQTTMQTGTEYNKKQLDHVNMFQIDEGYANTLNIKVSEGRWFEKQDAVANYRPVVINRTLKEDLFGNENALGKLIGGDNKSKVVGIVEDLKVKGDYTVPGRALYTRLDSSGYSGISKMLVNVTPGADIAFEGKLYQAVTNTFKNSNVEIEHLTSKRKAINYFALVPMIVLFIVAAFLIINVALGLFGVLWYNINRRRSEIGLRRAIGASGQSVSSQLVLEAMILSTLSLVAGAFFAVQFPLLNVFDLPSGVYITAIILAVLFIYVLVFVCALYPGKQAASIYPAVALHED